MDAELLDRLTIRQLVEDWAVLRDARQWERFRTVWHDDGVMQATWFQGTRDQRLHGFLVADVEHLGGDRIGAMLRGDLGRERCAVHDIGDHHARTFGRKRERIMPADPLGATGHDRHAVVEPPHPVLPFLLVGAAL